METDGDAVWPVWSHRGRGWQAEEEESGAMESAGGGVWPGLEAEPRWPAGRQGPWRDQLSSSPLSFESFLEVA